MNDQQNKINNVLNRFKAVPPKNASELAAYLNAFLGISFPSHKICPHHDSPMDYLAYAFLAPASQNSDILVWANRGGGKTQLGAAATLLDCIFKPHCQVRILGGSEQQSQQMYGYMRAMIDNSYQSFVNGKVTNRKCIFNNHSSAQVLTQSQSSVRGHHVQRLRCDEVELFDPEIWQAAQFITHTKYNIPARLEAMSTMHLPFGLMNELVTNSAQNNIKVFKWCLLDVLEKCRDRTCSQCSLYEDCRGLARKADGYYSIEDAIAQKKRSSKNSWRSEMLCLKPAMNDLVFSEFDPRINVKPVSFIENAQLFLSIDFGYSNPFACLLIQVHEDSVYVLDEHILARTTLDEHAKIIKQKWPYTISECFCDPAGRQTNDITGTSPVDELASHGIKCTSRASKITDGIEIIRDYILSGDNTVRLFVSPKCGGLIQAMQSLRYKRIANSITEQPLKDGVHDHAIDALRYFFVNFLNTPPANDPNRNY